MPPMPIKPQNMQGRENSSHYGVLRGEKVGTQHIYLLPEFSSTRKVMDELGRAKTEKRARCLAPGPRPWKVGGVSP